MIPVLIEGAAMPKATDLPRSIKSLATLYAFTLSSASFKRDAKNLTDALSELVVFEKPRNARGPAAKQTKKTRKVRKPRK